jgi:hypothetical protein
MTASVNDCHQPLGCYSSSRYSWQPEGTGPDVDGQRGKGLRSGMKVVTRLLTRYWGYLAVIIAVIGYFLHDLKLAFGGQHPLFGVQTD